MNQVFQLKITLNETNPPVWRELQVLDTTSIYELHHAIQLAFGWENCHLYCFSMNGNSYGDPELLEDFECKNDKATTVGELLKKEGNRMDYEYDFGDSWGHSIILEKIVPVDNTMFYPICTGGGMACPPEDCGGIPGFWNLLKVMKDKKHPEYEELVSWMGKPFDPYAFDMGKVNRNLKRIKSFMTKYEV